MLHKLLVPTIAALLAWPPAGVLAQEVKEDHPAEHDSHDGHNHQDYEHVGADDHNEEALDGEHEGHDHTDELIVEISREAEELVGLKMSTVVRGRVGGKIELPGEVGFNEDRLAHVSPRFAGIALEVHNRVGDYVDAGSAMAVVESNESMNSYTIKAPMSGWVIDRHITPGEFVSEENSIFVIADLSTVWVNLAVYPKDCDQIKSGQTAQIKAVGGMNSTHGTIDYVTPIMDFHTRSATARITLPNQNNHWRPGTFVQATVVSEGHTETLLVEKNAIQHLDEEKIVFVSDGPNRYRPVPVITGDSDDRYTQIISGLSEGTEYVSRGAFELKAEIVTSNLDAHAGHGH